MKCLIVSGGSPPDKQLMANHISKADLVICVDGAADVFAKHDAEAHVLIGDLDTAGDSSVSRLIDHGTSLIKLLPEKNETDTEAAFNYAIAQGARDIVLLGAIGTRFDHTLTNVMMLVRAHRAGVSCTMIDKHNEMTVSNGEFTLVGHAGQTVSILPLTGDVCVNVTNLKYPLNDLLLSFGSSRGVSNVMTGASSHISISGAYALIIKSTD